MDVLEIWNLFFRVGQDIALVRFAHSWDILVSTRNKFRISVHPCNILYLIAQTSGVDDVNNGQNAFLESFFLYQNCQRLSVYYQPQQVILYIFRPWSLLIWKKSHLIVYRLRMQTLVFKNCYVIFYYLYCM